MKRFSWMLVGVLSVVGCGGKVVIDASSSGGGEGGSGGGGTYACGDIECAAGEVCVKKVAFGETYECAKDACAPDVPSCSCAEPVCGDGFACVAIVGKFVTCECPNCKVGGD